MKEQYETAKADVKKAEEETQFNFTKKKGIAAEKKEARVEKEEAEKYQRLSRELVCCARIKSDPFCMHPTGHLLVYQINASDIQPMQERSKLV